MGGDCGLAVRKGFGVLRLVLREGWLGLFGRLSRRRFLVAIFGDRVRRIGNKGGNEDILWFWLCIWPLSARQICSTLNCHTDGDKHLHPMLMEPSSDKRRYFEFY